jgi:tripartite-type tricarboxylate transporter receptor subunit TctC
VALTMLPLLSAGAAQAQPAEDFFKGKRMALIVGFNPGGAYDVYARIAASWLPRYIPGQPAIVVRNMPGTGGAKAANFLYRQAEKDGLTLGMISQAAALQQVLRDPTVDYDVKNFNWIGRLTSAVEVTAVWHASPVKTIRDAMQREVVLASTSVGSTPDSMPSALNHVVGTKFKLIRGYQGTLGTLLAMERGEVEGGHATVENLVVGKPDWLRDRKISVLVQYAQERHPAFPDVPTMVELGESAEDKQVLNLFGSTAEIGRSIVAPPGVPAERVNLLRSAFAAMTADPAFRKDLQKRNIELAPMSGQDLQRTIEQTLKVSEAVLARAIATQPAN